MDLADPNPASVELGSTADSVRGTVGRPGAVRVYRLPRAAEWVERVLAGRCREVWLLMQPRPSDRVEKFVAGPDHQWLPLDALGRPLLGERVRRSPLGGPGDLAWVAESHWRTKAPMGTLRLEPRDGRWRPNEGARIYEGAACLARLPPQSLDRALWSSMPVWASRLVLRTEETTPRRLHSITAEEARQAGHAGAPVCPRTRFLVDFEIAHGPRSSSDDPWMWRVCFEPADARGVGALIDSGVARRKGPAARKLHFAKTVIE
ncbi:hypothetical protein [Aquimonas voraii]|uniref:Uncharacterized protein n=1 Tax=Aquimonas voraii TaxID=265719 RepID=A0A1G6ZQZ4_9GAMM|nr:hypothetical protein [Aquimonas voraii]SDE04647.1 hypothetical protein SAMN04488509_11526 [Aquimonas voraii]